MSKHDDHCGAIERQPTGSEIKGRLIDENEFFKVLDESCEISDGIVLRELVRQCAEASNAEKPKA